MSKDRKDNNTDDIFTGDKSILTAGAALAAQREIVSKKCLECGDSFDGIKKKAYCTEKCKQAAKYKRKKAEKAGG